MAVSSSPPYWASVQAVSVLAAAPTMAVRTGVAGPAAPAIALIVGQAGTRDHCAYLAAVGMFTAATMPILAQVCHWDRRRQWLRQVIRELEVPPVPPCHLLTCAHTAITFIAQATLAVVACTAHGLGCTGWGTHGLQLCPQAHPI